MRLNFKSVFKRAFILIVFFIVCSCSEEMQSSLKPIPSAFGELNQIIVVADDRVWNGPIGDTIRWYFSAAYPVLPQPEPIFDLAHFTPAELEAEPSRKELRTYLIVGNLSEVDSPTTQLIVNDIGREKARRANEDRTFNSTVGRDKWAKGQLVIYQFGYRDEDLMEFSKKNFPAIAQRVNKHDSPKIEATIYQSGVNGKLKAELKESLGVDMQIPGDYFRATKEYDFFWVRKETENLSSHIMLKKIPYIDKSQLTKEGIKSVRDTLGRYISSETENTYMKINDVDLPMLTSVKTINSYYALEARGYWEIANDYMGGAFVSYMLHNPKTNELLFVDGFIHAPGKEKRDFMQHVEYIMNSVQF